MTDETIYRNMDTDALLEAAADALDADVIRDPIVEALDRLEQLDPDDEPADIENVVDDVLGILRRALDDETDADVLARALRERARYGR